MPNDQAHVVAFLVAVGSIGVLGIAVFLWTMLTTPQRKPLAVQRAFDFESPTEHASPAALGTPPLNRGR